MKKCYFDRKITFKPTAEAVYSALFVYTVAVPRDSHLIGQRTGNTQKVTKIPVTFGSLKESLTRLFGPCIAAQLLIIQLIATGKLIYEDF